jgi:histidinol-phosphate aminotransferase
MSHPRSHISGLPPAIHGSIDYREINSLGISPDTIIDFSVNCNPYGPPPEIEQCIGKIHVERYPDTDSTELIHALSDALNTPAEQIIIGSGTTELIRLIVLAYFNSGDPVLIPQPTYSEYETSCRIVNARVINQPSANLQDMRISTGKIIEAIHEYNPAGIFLCNPNNPTGQYFSKSEFVEILSMAGDSLIVLDEAYIAFTENIWSSLDLINQGNLIILRSMTKDYALAGLRIGYAVSNKHTINALKRIKPPWNVNSVAQKAAVLALNVRSYVEECALKINEAKDYLIQELTALGFTVIPTQTNFFLVRTGNAAKFRSSLLKKRILVRDCASFGLPEYIRIAPRTTDECRLFIKAIKDCGA